MSDSVSCNHTINNNAGSYYMEVQPLRDSDDGFEDWPGDVAFSFNTVIIEYTMD